MDNDDLEAPAHSLHKTCLALGFRALGSLPSASLPPPILLFHDCRCTCSPCFTACESSQARSPEKRHQRVPP